MLLHCVLNTLLAGALAAGTATPTAPAPDKVPLAGAWRFALDPQNEGVTNNWFQQELPDQIQLPGTTDEAQKAPLNEAAETGRLTRVHPYVGAAWYQRDLDVPRAWAGKRVVLTLERTKSSRLWLDGKPIGEQSFLVAPHVYVLGTLLAGKHRLTLRVNNAELPKIGDAHQISDQTQTNWNGIVGELSLLLTDAVWIEDVQVYPDRAAHKVRVRVEVGNASGLTARGSLALSVLALKGGYAVPEPAPTTFAATGKSTVVEAEYDLGQNAMTWDEYSPALYRLSVALKALARGHICHDSRSVAFGLRDFKAAGTQFAINGKPIFLRGRVDSAAYPLTGYAPMTLDGWRRVFQIVKSYGLNHVRFHSWCPPEAAFAAADELGIYLQPELPNWMNFGDPAHDEFLHAEGERLLRAFGNHPSFVMLSLGNELGGSQEQMAGVVQQLRAFDSRHLYAQGTNNWFPGPGAGDDYYASFQYQGKKLRGSYATVDAPLGHVQIGPPSTLKDYTAEIAGLSVPPVSQEVGQYQVAPDFREIEKYTGVLRARNLEAFRKRLEEAGMLAQAGDFRRASGALAALCYREDIEAALRTRGFGGFQLLDLMDFPGQGTALVGMLNALMEPKGIIEPAKWREFCSETVPLLRMPKYTWINSETFTATVDLAHYGAADIANPAPIWTLRDGSGHLLKSGRLADKAVPRGTLTSLGEIQIPLNKYVAPDKLQLEISLVGTNIRNTYNFWLYPDAADSAPGKVVVSRALDDAARATLASGGSVLLVPDPASLTESIAGSFAPDFWNFGMFRKMAEERHAPVPPGTLGILCDPKHPAFAHFPTESHSNWQWFHLLMNSRALKLASLPAPYRPLVQVIDNDERALKLGALFEAQVGTGKLLVCAIDLIGQKDKPEARQLLSSLLAYMNSDAFAPTTAVDDATLANILK